MQEIEKKLYVAEIRPGDRIDDIFLLSEKNLSHKKDGNPYLTLVLADKSGQVKGVAWDNVEQINGGVQTGDFVLVSANASEYRGAVQVVVRAMKAVPPETVQPADYLPATQRNVDQMFDRLKDLTGRMNSQPLRNLMEAFWRDSDFVSRFKRSPAAKLMHHAYLGGLLEHTLSMALLGEKIATHYDGVDRDLLLAGIILHDIGKVRELSCDINIDYTDEGRLLSHIVIALELVDEKIRQVESFPDQTAALVKHMIISHHGAREFGSPEPPKTIEAVLLNYIDEIDSRINAIREFMAREDPDSVWTSYHRLLERHFYKGSKSG